MARNRYYDSRHWDLLKQRCHQRDDWCCTVPGCGSRERLVCDHIATRPNVDQPTSADVLANVRTLCGQHDRQLKERPGGDRRRQGKAKVIGCDATGMPVDPLHHWSRS